MAVKICTHCRSKVKLDKEACPSCGGKEFWYKCSGCGEVFNSRYCPRCGLGAGEQPKVCPKCGKTYFSASCPDCGWNAAREDALKYAAQPQRETVYVQDAPRKRAGLGTILLWIFFSPIMGCIAIIRSQKLSLRWKIGLVAAIIVVTLALGLTRNDEAPATASREALSAALTQTPAPPQLSPAPTASAGAQGGAENAETVAQLMKDTLEIHGAQADVTYDRETNTFWAEVMQEGVAEHLAALTLNGESMEEWYEVRDAFIGLSNSMQELAQAYGMQDASAGINLLNDKNKENTLLTILNGVVLYDAAADGADTKQPAAAQEPAAEQPAAVQEPAAQESAPEQPAAGAATKEQRNALESAKGYLRAMAFSHSGLVKQLEYENYAHEAALYAADNCGADWNEQALKSARSYLDTMAFSHTGLVKQLKYEGYTDEQAAYGAGNCGADWKQQAVKSAASYLELMSFSRSELIDQLEYEGYTREEAEYGAAENGY